MKCPFCGHLSDKVVDSRESKEGEVIRRRRECQDCGRRFTSYERIDEIPYMVVKKDGSRERFERQKMTAGMLKACEKRPVTVAAVEAIADRVEARDLNHGQGSSVRDSPLRSGRRKPIENRANPYRSPDGQRYEFGELFYTAAVRLNGSGFGRTRCTVLFIPFRPL